MKKINALLIAVIAFAAFAFTGPVSPKGEQTYKFDSSKSVITWLGKKVTGEHTGNIKLSEGSLSVNGKKITGGKLDIDMNSITCSDVEDKTYNEKLVGHLKSDDFFGSQKFPKASFVVKKAEPKGGDNYQFTGDLTIKGITKEVSFPAIVKIDGKKINAEGKITVDRTKFDVKYGSGTFFDNLGDKTIYDDFDLNFKLTGAAK